MAHTETVRQRLGILDRQNFFDEGLPEGKSIHLASRRNLVQPGEALSLR